MNHYFYYDGQNPIGPHSASEIGQLLRSGLISTETLVFLHGTKDWQAASLFPELFVLPSTEPSQTRPVTAENIAEPGEQQQNIPSQETTSADESQEDINEDPDNEQELSKYQIIRMIRSELDRLWECQRESIIATIKNQELEEEYTQTRKQAREIKINIENLSVDYFRKSHVLRDWIRDLTWQSEDYKRGRADVTCRLQGESCQERYLHAMEWLEKRQLLSLEGCYCFRNADKAYRYIGKAQSQNIGQRLKQWERASFWLESTHLRVVIPKLKSQTGKLERLLIMLHQPLENEKSGDRGGNNPADKVIEMIHKEIKDLLVDG